MKRKFFFFDIDGTLAVGTPGNQYVPESTKIAISKLKRGWSFCCYCYWKELCDGSRTYERTRV